MSKMKEINTFYVNFYRKGLQEASQAILDDYGLSICVPDRSGIICLKNNIQGSL